MANPFPGMDPYLEGNLWPAVRTEMVAAIRRRLNEILRPRYVAVTIQRTALIEPDMAAESEWAEPDVFVGGAPFTATYLEPKAIPIDGVEIRDGSDGLRVTAIEVLAAEDKTLGYYRRIELLATGTHIVEIDLLRGGSRFPTPSPLPEQPYYAFVCRGNVRPRKLEVWPTPFATCLPVIAVPLAAGDADVVLDLQDFLDSLQAANDYDRLIDYTQPPPGALSPDDLAWIDERLRAAGKRP